VLIGQRGGDVGQLLCQSYHFVLVGGVVDREVGGVVVLDLVGLLHIDVVEAEVLEQVTVFLIKWQLQYALHVAGIDLLVVRLYVIFGCPLHLLRCLNDVLG
jgi:hypothetical protein